MVSSLVNRRAALGGLSLSAVLALTPRLAAAQIVASGAAAVGDAVSQPFSVEGLRERARALAAAPYAKPAAPPTITGLTYDEYFRIRFRPEADLWKDRQPPFRAEFFPPAWLYPRPLPIFEVAGGLARPIAFDPAMFDIPGEHADVAKAWNGFSGFRLLWPLNEAGKMDEVAVFQGASYFRSLGRGQRYGLSARGLAIGAGEPNEEFPDFTSFWLERPAIDGDAVVVHALMDSPSCAGVYSFTIRPGEDVVFDVAASIFPRATMTRMGAAAMSSMFLFNVADPSPQEDYRTAVHDSDGLAIWTGQGEHIWRPLQNPKAHRLSNFPDQNPKGFGLVQRTRALEDFGDLQARYDLRPSLWVEPLDAWGEGAVHLAELATTKESDDNIAIFWRPKTRGRPEPRSICAIACTGARSASPAPTPACSAPAPAPTPRPACASSPSTCRAGPWPRGWTAWSWTSRPRAARSSGKTCRRIPTTPRPASPSVCAPRRGAST
jgi:glucans biosynthesis protein